MVRMLRENRVRLRARESLNRRRRRRSVRGRSADRDSACRASRRLHGHGREHLHAVGAPALVQAHHTIVEAGRGILGRHARQIRRLAGRARGCGAPLGVCGRVVARASSEPLSGDERDQRDQRDRGDSPRQGRREASLVARRLSGRGAAPMAELRARRELRSARRAGHADECGAASGAEPPARRGAARRTGLLGAVVAGVGEA